MMSSSLKLSTTYMAACGRCGGRLRVEAFAGVVVCPHCGEELIVADDPAKLADVPTLPPADEHRLDASGSVLDSETAAAAVTVSTTPDLSRWDGSDPQATPLDPHAGHPGEVFHAAEHAEPPPSDETPGTVAGRPGDTASVAKPQAVVGVSRGAWLALIVYASAVTAACLVLLYSLFLKPPHALESLPDVVPKTNENGEIARVLVPPDAALPPGHVLALGEARRFGDLLVTPLKVTREPLAFTHYRGGETREPAGEVLKLWLKFENVSETGRSFTPLGGELLFYRLANGSSVKANNYLAPADDRSAENLVFVYDHPPDSDWNLAGQRLGTVLAPGESVVMYVPSETDVPELRGPLAWRVHLRKGVAGNGWGVTTLVEVKFAAGEIQGS